MLERLGDTTFMFLEALSQFMVVDKQYSDTYGLPYDYRSVMHFAPFEASKNGKPTIIAKDRSFHGVIGRATTASKGDYKKICAMYGCSKCLGRVVTIRGDENSNEDENDLIV